MAEAEKTMATYLRNPDAGRIATKLDARRTFAQQWQGYCNEEAANAWNSQKTRRPGAEMQPRRFGSPASCFCLSHAR
jgi:hypothetical protein